MEAATQTARRVSGFHARTFKQQSTRWPISKTIGGLRSGTKTIHGARPASKTTRGANTCLLEAFEQ
eukprot:6138381-Alexandrium_andersonii.AAC.1